MSADLEPDQSPWSGRGFIAAAVVLGVIVALGMAIVVSNLVGGGPGDPPTAAENGAVDPGQQTSSVDSDSVCGLTDIALTGTVDQPPAAEWTLLGTIAVPAADGVGPGVVNDDGFRYCFAHTPEGSLFMAANAAGMGARPQLERQFVEHFVAEGPGRTAALGDVGTHTGSGDTAGVRVQIAGFRILSYDGDRASVDLAFRVSTGATMVQALDLVWRNGDWRIEVAPDGELQSDMAQVPDLSGYTPWGGA